MLIDRGHKIDPPHPPYCRCKQCLVQADTDDLLNASAARLNIYRAIANPAYIAQSSLDPGSYGWESTKIDFNVIL